MDDLDRGHIVRRCHTVVLVTATLMVISRGYSIMTCHTVVVLVTVTLMVIDDLDVLFKIITIK